VRIVVVMIEPPLPFGNAAARWFYVLLKGLVARGHQVTALAACSRAEDMEKARKLFPAPEYDLRCFPFAERQGGLRTKLESLTRPFSYMFSDELRRELKRELARGFDILHLEQLWSAWLGLEHVERALVNVHHLTWIDLEHTRPEGAHAQFTQTLMTLTERQLVRKMKHLRSCSPRLVPELRKENPGAEITTIPVGLEPEQYRFIPDAQRTGAPVVSVIGTMGWYPTHSAAVRLHTRLWPRIKQQGPEAKVQIVGWSARSALREFLDMPDVTIEENVPDIQPYFERTGVMLYAPGRGSGMKIKILEALGFGIPVVTTSEGVEGLPAVDGVHAAVAEDDDALVERAVALLKDRELQNRVRHHGRQLFEQHCGPKPTLDALEQVYARMLSR